jgi:hypothetical protein
MINSNGPARWGASAAMSDSVEQPTSRGRTVLLAAAFLGWLTAGIGMGLGPLAGKPTRG